jgi:GntR family transcriptional regulator
VAAVAPTGAVILSSQEVVFSCDPLYYNSMTLVKQHDKPVYVRLRETIADAILAGTYGDGDPLPSVRALAAAEQANPLTVAKAYQGFQDEGLITVKRGVGMFVAPGARARLAESERNRFLKDEWPEIRARMRRLGISAAELLERERA